MDRPSIEVYMMGMAILASSRGTCSRRKVGCILVNRLNHIIATGYNGPPRGMAHCGLEICPGMMAASGTGLDGCMATHGEQNALLQCRDVEEIDTAYVTASPCLTCTKLLLNTGCRRIVYLEEYPHSAAADLWQSTGRRWSRMSAQGLVQLQSMFQAAQERSGSALTASHSS